MQSGLIFVALLCGITRIQDNKHHPRDVTVGFLIGVIVAIAAVRTMLSNILQDDNVDVSSLRLHAGDL